MNQQEAENFVRVWQTSSSGKEVADRLGLTDRQVSGRAYRLRKQGVPLKTHGGNQRPFDLDALRRLAESLGGDDSAAAE